MTAQIARIGVIIPPMLLGLAALSTAQAAEPTGTLTLACEGTEITERDAGTSSKRVNIGVIVDFQKKVIHGVSDSRHGPLTITDINEMRLDFLKYETWGTRTTWIMTGTLDRISGALTAKEAVESQTVSWNLQCKPTQRVF